MNVLTNAFQDGFFYYQLWTDSGPTSRVGTMQRIFLLGLNSLAIHDQTFRAPPPDADGSVPSLRAGRLAGNA